MVTPVFLIEVEDFDVDRLLMAVDFAIGEQAMAQFLSNDVLEYFHNQIYDRFLNEGDSASGRWLPLADATIDIRRWYGFGDEPINERTGEMMDFVMKEHDYDVGPGWASLDIPGDPKSDAVRYKLITAQQGSNVNPLGYGPTPPRPVLAVDVTDMAAILEMLNMDIIRTVSQGALGLI